MPKKALAIVFLMLFLSPLSLVFADSDPNDAEGCKDYPLFNRMPNYHLAECDSTEFDARKFPVGPPLEEQKPRVVEVEGTTYFLRYLINDGATPSSGLQIMRNFENATKKQRLISNFNKLI